MQLKKFGPAGILNWIDLIDAQGSSRYPGEIIPPLIRQDWLKPRTCVRGFFW